MPQDFLIGKQSLLKVDSTRNYVQENKVKLSVDADLLRNKNYNKFDVSKDPTSVFLASPAGAGIGLTEGEYPLDAYIRIGNQMWGSSNLAVRKYRNGDSISTSDYFDYNGNTVSQSLYGFLYSWNAVTDARGLAPIGYHVPSRTEFDILTGSVTSGLELKQSGTTNWLSPNIGATNSVKFTALPAGIINGSNYQFQTSRAYFWTSTVGAAPLTQGYAYAILNTSLLGYTSQIKTIGMSVRLLKD